MFEKIYKDLVIEKPKITLLFLTILLLSFGYFAKNFQLDASSDTLLLENDPDLKYLREVNTKYGSIQNPDTTSYHQSMFLPIFNSSSSCNILKVHV